MKSIFSAGKYQHVLVNDVYRPLKHAIVSWSGRELGMKDFVKAFRGLLSLPDPTKENTFGHNDHILIETRDEMFRHFKDLYYTKIFRTLINLVIKKYNIDQLYRALLDWWLGELIRRGWQFPGHNRPSSVLWNTLPQETRARLGKSIRDNYQMLQDRLKVIQEKFGDSEEGKIHRVSRMEQFTKRIEGDFEREVIAWR